MEKACGTWLRAPQTEAKKTLVRKLLNEREGGFMRPHIAGTVMKA